MPTCKLIGWGVLLSLLLTAMSPASLEATPTVTVPAGATYFDSWPCAAAGICHTLSYLDDTAQTGTSVTTNTDSTPRIMLAPPIPYPGGNLFSQGFNAWNAMGGGQGWTLAAGTDLGGSFDVTVFATQTDLTAAPCNAAGGVDGMCINVLTGNLTGIPALGANEQYVWAQALFDNYLLDGSLVTPFFEMDVMAAAGCSTVFPTFGTGKTACPPAYPFQYADNHFFDAPSDPVPGAFFAAEAFFGEINYTTKTLTLFDGLDYGWINVPEPSTAWLLAVGVAGWVGRRVLRRRRHGV